MTNTDTGEINKMILNVIIEGLILGLLLIFVCATAKRRGLSDVSLTRRGVAKVYCDRADNAGKNQAE